MSRQEEPITETTQGDSPGASRWIVVAICILLAALVGIVFGQTLDHDFVNYDDMEYVTKNAQVSRGLSLEGIGWAFTHFHSANWHPLTWISHMIDCQLYGLNPWGHHLTNVLLHAVNAILLFLALRQLTAKLWPSAFVAALFAIHPLRVESVAWVSERKDLLSGLFFILTIMAYRRYTRSRHWSRLLLVSTVFALGLMAKPMLVTVPIILLLLDYWPLSPLPNLSLADRHHRKVLLPLILEKAPLFLLALGSSVLTILAQRQSILAVAHIPGLGRLANAAVSYLDYIQQMFWPKDLAILYPWYAERLQLWNVTLGCLLLAGVTAAVIVLRRRRYLVVGWFWYVVMLVPVIGILQVGSQSHADRYTYLPLIGLYLMLTWAAADVAARWRLLRIPAAALASAIVIVLTLTARAQTATWRNSESLWSHALAVTPDNVIAECNLGLALHANGRDGEALEHFERSLFINPRQPEVLASLGVFYLEQGRIEDSLAHLHQALDLEPRLAAAHYNLGNTYLAIGKANEAVIEYQYALEIEPDDTQSLNNLAWILATWPDAAVRNGPKAVALAERADSLSRGQNQVIAATLAATYAETGRFPDAIGAAERAERIAKAEGNQPRALFIHTQLETYKSGKPWRDDRFSGQ